MVWRNIKGKAGKFGYTGNLSYNYSDLIEDIYRGRMDYAEIPLDNGNFNIFGVDSSIMAILKIEPIRNQLDNIYLHLLEDLVDLNGDYNRANLYLREESMRQVTPKYSKDGCGMEGYGIKGILKPDNLSEIVHKTELIERLNDSPFVRLIATKFENSSKKEGEIEQTLYLNIDSDLLEMRVIAKPFTDNGKNLLRNDGMERFINELDLQVDSETIMKLRETYLSSSRRYLKRVVDQVKDIFYRF